MKRIFTQLLCVGILFVTTLTNTSIAQTQLLLGYRSGSSYSDSLTYIDTTGGTFTIVESKLLTTDNPDITEIDGLYGMAIQPFTGDMYVIYGTGSSSERRLGTMDISDASITDIDSCGNITDITFIDDKLYGTTGSEDSYNFVNIDPVTADFTVLYQHLNANWSNAINFDYYKNRILKSTQAGGGFWDGISTGTLEETNLTSDGHPGWTTTVLTLNDSLALLGGSSNINLLNTNTFEYVSAFSAPANVHSLCFAELEPALWVNGSRVICAPASTELVFLGAGTTFEWYKDDVLVDDVDTSAYEVSESGTYHVVVDGKKSNPVVLDIIEVVASFAILENPVFLDGAASIEVDFFETVLGTGYVYDWDSGDGETSTDENPTFEYSAIGEYDVTLVVTDPSVGCTGTSTQTLEVAGGLFINELSIDFNVYPIPSNDIVSIDYNGSTSYTVNLMDIKGAIIGTHIITPNTSNKIDINALDAGTYFLNITDGERSTKRKIVKQ